MKHAIVIFSLIFTSLCTNLQAEESGENLKFKYLEQLLREALKDKEVRIYEHANDEIMFEESAFNLKRLFDFELNKNRTQILEIPLTNLDKITYCIFQCEDYFYDHDIDNAIPQLEFSNKKQILDSISFGSKLTSLETDEWLLLGKSKLDLNTEKMYRNYNLSPTNIIKPLYIENHIGINDSLYNANYFQDDANLYFRGDFQGKNYIKSIKSNKQAFSSFKMSFYPPISRGLYKLFLVFESRQKSYIKDDEVYIGIHSFKISDLNGFLKHLQENFKQGELELISKIELMLDDNIGLEVSKVYEFEKNYIVRVLRGHPSKPVIDLPRNIRSFDKFPPLFEFIFSPYIGEASQSIQAWIVDSQEKVCGLLDIMISKSYLESKVRINYQGRSMIYSANTGKALKAGKYKLIFKAKQMGIEANEETYLEIFESRLTDESLKKVEKKLSKSFEINSSFEIEFEPMSGEKIKAKEFKIIIDVDDGKWKKEIEGWTISKEDNIIFSDGDKKFNIQFIWVQPYSGREVVIYEKKNIKIKERE